MGDVVMAKMASTRKCLFAKLPYEVLEMILDNVSLCHLFVQPGACQYRITADKFICKVIRPSDLKSVCLVSKNVSDLASKRLYRDIVMPNRDDDPQWERIEILSQSSRIKDIQTLQIGTWPTRYETPRYCENLSVLIPKLLPHTLRSFVFESYCRPRSDYLVLLWKMQRNLHKLYLDFQLCAPAINEIAHFHKAVLQNLDNVQELEIVLAAEGERETSLLFDCLNLKSLRRIKLESVLPRSDLSTELNLGSTFFSRYLPRTLTHICFREMALPPTDNWELSEFQGLESLILMHCRFVNPVLDRLRPKSLKHLHIIGSDAHPRTLLNCLYSFCTLETLGLTWTQELHIPVAGEPLVGAILHHRLQLKALRIASPFQNMISSLLDCVFLQCLKMDTLILGSGLWRTFYEARVSFTCSIPRYETELNHQSSPCMTKYQTSRQHIVLS